MDKKQISDFGKKIYLNKILTKVENDEFEIVSRVKNVEFIFLYKLDMSKIKLMLLSLTEDDLVYETIDTDYLKFGPELLLVFIKEFELVNRYGIRKIEKIYIKIKFKEEILPIISFHNSENDNMQ